MAGRAARGGLSRVTPHRPPDQDAIKPLHMLVSTSGLCEQICVCRILRRQTPGRLLLVPGVHHYRDGKEQKQDDGAHDELVGGDPPRHGREDLHEPGDPWTLSSQKDHTKHRLQF